VPSFERGHIFRQDKAPKLATDLSLSFLGSTSFFEEDFDLTTGKSTNIIRMFEKNEDRERG
jgi:hypothetical protein